MPRADFDRETSRWEELPDLFLRPHTLGCPGRARRYLTITISKSIIITPVLSQRLVLKRAIFYNWKTGDRIMGRGFSLNNICILSKYPC